MTPFEFTLGSHVFIGGDIPCQVIGRAEYSDGRIQYQVAWWDGRTRYEEWVGGMELSGHSRDYLRQPP